MKLQTYDITVESESSWDGEYVHHYLDVLESDSGRWVEASEASNLISELEDRIKRMQKRLDKHEGRA